MAIRKRATLKLRGGSIAVEPVPAVRSHVALTFTATSLDVVASIKAVLTPVQAREFAEMLRKAAETLAERGGP
jgi:hypothetical protein